MGCIQQKSKKQHKIQSPEPVYRQKVRNASEPPRQPAITAANIYRSQKQDGKRGGEIDLQPLSSKARGSGSQQTTKSITDKYSVSVKESCYKTPNVHAYNYQPLIIFNPPRHNLDVTDREMVDRTYAGLHIPTLNDIHNKLLFTKH